MVMRRGEDGMRGKDRTERRYAVVMRQGEDGMRGKQTERRDDTQWPRGEMWMRIQNIALRMRMRIRVTEDRLNELERMRMWMRV